MVMYCKHCKEEKPETAFYPSSKSRCKACVLVSATAYRQENLERIRAYDRLRGAAPHRVAAREEYRKTVAYAQSHKAAAERWAAKHPLRRKANVILGNAVKNGVVIPWPVCAVPECFGIPQGHHPDYSRPLDVVWLCAKHHCETHALIA